MITDRHYKEFTIRQYLLHIYKDYRRYVIGVVFFIFGLALGLSNLLFTSSEPVIPEQSSVAQELSDMEPAESASFPDEPVPTETVLNNMPGDEPMSLEETKALTEPSEIEHISKEIRIKKGQGLMDALVDSGADRQDAFNAIRTLGDLFNVRKIQVGQKFDVSYTPDGTLNRIEMQKDFDHLIVVNRDGLSYKGETEELPSQIITRHASGIIDDSLFLAAQKQGLPQVVIVDLIRIFSYDVDFQREIRQGDQFEIFYERKISEDGRRVQEGDIIFARMVLSGKEIKLYRYTPPGKDFADYFHEDGQSSKRALMKTPIEGARLSSYYGNRKHPVLGYNRMHKGIDFSAPTGTPIMAAGDGVVERASWFGSFGNYVRIRHNSTYQTIYAHMSKYGRGIKKGVRVKQGQIIGYVGATGRVTGRHLHYEVYMNGTQVNPLTLKIPSGIKLKESELEDFKLAMKDTDLMIAQTKSHILLTHNTPNTNTAIASSP
ncbi:MAG: peptidoglycan DD-metalloendopeptidase family protein [Emcibacteraceae bacterium]